MLARYYAQNEAVTVQENIHDANQLEKQYCNYRCRKRIRCRTGAQVASGGWNVAVTDIDEERARQTYSSLQRIGGDSFYMQLDITRQEHWQQMHDTVLQKWGGLQVLVNNAGVAAAGNVEDTSMEDWTWVLDIDLMGVVRGCHQFAAMMKQQKAGHIVNISSFAGLAGLPFIAAYGVAKAGVVALSEALRAEMHPYGVGVTVACPCFCQNRFTGYIQIEPRGHRIDTTPGSTNGWKPQVSVPNRLPKISRRQSEKINSCYSPTPRHGWHGE